MSSDNFETGRIKLLFYSVDKQLMESFLKDLCKGYDITEKLDGYTWKEVFEEDVAYDEDYKPRYMILGNGVFEVLDYQSFDDHYHTKIVPEGNDEFTFSSSYYNGGASLEETLEDEFKNKGFFGTQGGKSSDSPIVYGETYLD